MKTWITNTLITVTCVAAGIAVLVGLAWLLNHRTSEWKAAAEKGCKTIAETSNIKEYKVDENYNCYLVKDGKIVEVKDWQ